MQTENSKKFYDIAYSMIGYDASPRDRAPDSIACAESVNAIHKRTFGYEIGGGESTYELLQALMDSREFEEVTEPLPGDVVMNATGTSTKHDLPLLHGHCGIWGRTHVMSNNSLSGRWDSHYTKSEWIDLFEKYGGYPTRWFRKK